MRADLAGSLPIVYNGRSVEEWHTLYTQIALQTAREKTIREALVRWLRDNAMFTCAGCVRNSDMTGRHVNDLRNHNGAQICRYCYMMVVWPDEAGEPPAWKSLPAFDPFAGLL